MSYPVLPPEVNSALMHAGAGSGPMLAAATAWTGLANELRTAASSFASVTSGLVGSGWDVAGPFGGGDGGRGRAVYSVAQHGG